MDVVDVSVKIGLFGAAMVILRSTLRSQQTWSTQDDTMLTPEGQLSALEFFIPDERLPKRKRLREKRAPIATTPWVDGAHSGGAILTNAIAHAPRPRHPADDWFSRAWRWFSRLFSRQTRPALTVEEFFREVKNSAEEVQIVDARAGGYRRLLEKAKASGQDALHEQLLSGIDAVRAESQLLAIGLGKFVSEEKLIEFAKKTERPVRIDPVKNFGRPIPDRVQVLQQQADERYVFDGYVVMHYDPKKKAVIETQKEKAARRDPILFGVVEGKRRLYFVGDWVDEQCDLTLDKLADVTGADAVETVSDVA